MANSGRDGAKVAKTDIPKNGPLSYAVKMLNNTIEPQMLGKRQNIQTGSGGSDAKGNSTR